MIYKKDEFLIDDINCIGYLCDTPKYILMQPVDENDIAVLDYEIEVLASQVKDSFLMIAFQVKSWNNDLSPWMMEAVFGKEDFGGGAKNILHFVEERLLPMILNKYNIDDNIKIILGGYSLAGLFSLWCSYQTEKFNAIVAASPSVWFSNWEEYIKDNIPLTNLIYLSLGDKEEKTQNKVMRRVGDAIRTQDMLLNKQKIPHTLEWNEGGHFVDSELRMAKGFSWCIESPVK